MPSTWIAEERVIFEFADGRREHGRIAVAQPERVAAQEARCEIAVDGYHDRLTPITGNSPLQSLLLALRFMGSLLHDFSSRGGRVLHPDGTALALDAFCGPLLCDPRRRSGPGS